MKVVIAKTSNVSFIIMLLLAVTAIPNTGLCGNSGKDKTIRELTKTFQADGWKDLTFRTSGKDTVSIRHAGAIQNPKLTEGQLVSALGSILKPDVVLKLKRAGFSKGIFVDGKDRKYPFEVSTKYYNELQKLFRKLSGNK